MKTDQDVKEIAQPTPNKSSCKSGKESLFLCADSKCHLSPPILCINQNCQCHTPHSNCIKIMASSLTTKLKSKILPNNQIQTFIEGKFNQIIDKISQIKQNLHINLQSNFKYWGLTNFQRQFYIKLVQGNIQHLNGSTIWNCTKFVNQSNDQHNKVKDITSSLEKQFYQLESLVGSENIKLMNLIEILYEKKYTNFEESNIIKTKTELETIKNFFADKTILNADILYKASQNQFQVAKFWSKCSKIPNNLLIVQTSTKQKIGAFSPLQWLQAEPWKNLSDQNLQSFLFSLSHGDKFSMKSKQNAIILHKDPKWGPDYGAGRDLIISDKANMKNSSHTKFNTTYFNEKYKEDKDSFKRFCGSETGYFQVLEWEMWKVELASIKNGK